MKSSMAVVESNMALLAHFLNQGKRQTILSNEVDQKDQVIKRLAQAQNRQPGIY